MSRYQSFKNYSKKLFIDAYNLWNESKGEFLLNFFLLTLLIFCVGFLGFMILWGLVAGAIATYNAIQGDIFILFYIVSGIALIVGIPSGIIFLGKHFKANQE